MGGAGLQFAFRVFHHQRVAVATISISCKINRQFLRCTNPKSNLPACTGPVEPLWRRHWQSPRIPECSACRRVGPRRNKPCLVWFWAGNQHDQPRHRTATHSRELSDHAAPPEPRVMPAPEETTTAFGTLSLERAEHTPIDFSRNTQLPRRVACRVFSSGSLSRSRSGSTAVRASTCFMVALQRLARSR